MRLIATLSLLCACTGGSDPKDTTHSTPGGDTAADSDTGTDAAQAISDVSWEVHDEIGAIVRVRWSQAAAADVFVSYGLDGEEAMATPTEARAAGSHEALLLGVPYDTDFRFQIVAGDASSEVTAAQTGALPDTAPVPDLNASVPEAWQSDDRWLLIGISAGGDGWATDGFWKLILDRAGRIVWAHATPGQDRTFYMQPSPDGADILWDEDSFWSDFDKGKTSVVHRMKIDGTITETIPMPGMHHAFLALPDGSFLWGGKTKGREVLNEMAPDGSVQTIFDCTAYWREHNSPDRCDSNALFWNPEEDTVYFSSDAGHTVVEIDRQTGAVLHTWGQLENAWPFTEGSSNFWKQHSPTRTPDGTLLLSMWTDATNHEIVAREYEIDAENEQLHEVWTCSLEDGIIGEYAGEAHRFANGNTMINYGDGGAIREYTDECALVWEVRWPDGNMTGRATFLADLYTFAP